MSSATRIPIEHLRAIEDGRIDDIPAGPYADAYLRTLEDHLDVPLDDASPTAVDSDSGVPLWAVRWLAAVSVLVVFGTVTWQTWKPGTDTGPVVEVDIVSPALQVKITPRKTARLTVSVDDIEVLTDQPVPGGETLVFAGDDRVTIEVPSVGAVRIEYDDQVIVPMGRQDAPRRLVFIDDVGGGR